MRQYLDGDKLEMEDGTVFILSAREACILNYIVSEYPHKLNDVNVGLDESGSKE